MPRLRGDISGAASTGQIINFLAPYVLEAIRKLFSELYKNVKHLPLWVGYHYHIHPPLREKMYSYIKEGDGLEERFTRVGFIFGDQRLVSGVKSTAVYAFLPIWEILGKYGGTKINGTDIEKLAKIFADAAKRRKKPENINAIGEKLLELVFTIGEGGELHNMLTAAKEYLAAYKKLKTAKKRRAFLEATFLGMYAASERFEKIALLGYFSHLTVKAQVQGVEKIKGDLKVLRKAIREREKEFEEEIKLDRKGNPTAIVQKRLFGIFRRPPYKKVDLENRIKELEKELKEREIFIPPPLLVVNVKDLEILKRIFELSDDFMLKQNKARVPVVVDLYKDKQPPISSLCAGFDEKEDLVKQIKFIDYFGTIDDRIESVIKEIGI